MKYPRGIRGATAKTEVGGEARLDIARKAYGTASGMLIFVQKSWNAQSDVTSKLNLKLVAGHIFS